MVNHRMSSKLSGVLVCMVWCSLVFAQGIAGSPYLGQIPPGLEPQIFAPDIVTLQTRSEWTGSFTPDGQEFYFSVSHTVLEMFTALEIPFGVSIIIA